MTFVVAAALARWRGRYAIGAWFRERARFILSRNGTTVTARSPRA